MGWRSWGWYAGQWLAQWNPVDLIALSVAGVVAIWLIRTSLDKTSTYAFSDNLVDPYTNKASASALAYMTLLGLSVWWIIREGVSGGDASNTLLLVLGVFVAKAGADRAISAWGSRVPDKAPTPPGVDADIVVPPPIELHVDAPAEVSTTTKVKRGK